MAWCIKCQLIYEKLLPLPKRGEQCGMVLHLLDAMSGSVGLLLLRSQKLEDIISSGHVQRFLKESADHVVGQVALIVEIADD